MSLQGELIVERRLLLSVLRRLSRHAEEDGHRRSLLLRFAGGRLVLEIAGLARSLLAVGRWPEQVRLPAWPLQDFTLALTPDPYVRLRVAGGFLEYGMQILPCEVLRRRRRVPEGELPQTTGGYLRLGAVLGPEEQLDLGILEEVEAARARFLAVVREGLSAMPREVGEAGDLESAARFLVDPWTRVDPRPPVLRESYPPPRTPEELSSPFPSRR